MADDALPSHSRNFSHSLQSVQVDVAPIQLNDDLDLPTSADRPPPLTLNAPTVVENPLATPSASPSPPRSPSPARISSTLSCWQLFYVIVFQGVGSMLLDAGVNFGLHILIFKEGAKLWELPNSIAGDCFVTALMECVLTWVIASQLQFTDLRKGIVRPVHVVRLKRRRSVRSLMRGTPLPDTSIEELVATQRPWRRFLRWLLRSDDAVAGPEVVKVTGGRCARWAVRLRIIGRQAARGAVWTLPFVAVFWPLGVGISGGIWGDDGFGAYPTPEGVMAVYGGLLGLVITPLLALITLNSAAEDAADAEAAALSARLRGGAASSGGARLAATELTTDASLSSDSDSSNPTPTPLETAMFGGALSSGSVDPVHVTIETPSPLIAVQRQLRIAQLQALQPSATGGGGVWRAARGGPTVSSGAPTDPHALPLARPPPLAHIRALSSAAAVEAVLEPPPLGMPLAVSTAMVRSSGGGIGGGSAEGHMSVRGATPPLARARLLSAGTGGPDSMMIAPPGALLTPRSGGLGADMNPTARAAFGAQPAMRGLLSAYPAPPSPLLRPRAGTAGGGTRSPLGRGDAAVPAAATAAVLDSASDSPPLGLDSSLRDGPSPGRTI